MPYSPVLDQTCLQNKRCVDSYLTMHIKDAVNVQKYSILNPLVVNLTFLATTVTVRKFETTQHIVKAQLVRNTETASERSSIEESCGVRYSEIIFHIE